MTVKTNKMAKVQSRRGASRPLRPARKYNSKGLKAPPRPPRPARGSGSAPSPSAVRAAQKSNRDLLSGQIASHAGKALTYNDGDTGVFVAVQVNAMLLSQFYSGFLAKCMSLSDDIVDNNTLPSVVNFFMSNTESYSSSGIDLIPRRIAEVIRGLQTKTVGKYTFTPNWVGVNRWTQDFALNQLNFTNSGFNYYNTTSTFSGGFAGNTISTGTVFTAAAVAQWLSTYAKQLDLVQWSSFPPSPRDASAFAFDTTFGIMYNSADSNTSLEIGSLCGYLSVSTPTAAYQIHVRQCGVAGLEVPIRTRWLAELRLGTRVEYNIGSTTGTGGSVDGAQSQNRRPIHTVECRSLPCVWGWRLANPVRYPGQVLMKPVPYLQAVQDIVDRLEATISAAGTSAISAWQSAFSANDIKVLASAIIRGQMIPLSGSDCGSSAYADAVFQSACVGYSIHVGYESLKMIRLPQSILECIGALTPYVDRLGVILPFLSGTSSIAAVTTSLTYSGSGQVSAVPGEQAAGTALTQQMGVCNAITGLVSIYKPLEIYMAPVTNLLPITEVGESMLDVTVLRSSINQTSVCGFAARRPFTDEFLSNVYRKSAYLGYDYLYQSSTTFPSNSNNSNNSQRSLEYSQAFWRSLSGFDSYASLISNFRADGLVPQGTLTSNTSDKGIVMSNPDGEYYENVPSSLYRFRGLGPDPLQGPRYGKYCGKSYTAGSETGGSEPRNPPMSDGKYLVPPVDAVDAICKAHDEGYHRAAGNRQLEIEADEKMVSELDKLSLGTKGVAGTVMRHLISANKNIKKATQGNEERFTLL